MIVTIHGENILKPVDKLPKGKKTLTKKHIVGHSETGHHHVLESRYNYAVIESGGETYLQLFEDAELKHQKSHDIHETLNVKSGIYKVYRAKEYDPFQKVMREVWD